MNLLSTIIFYVFKFIGYALLTFVLELPVALIGFGRKKMVVIYCFLINMITNLTINIMIALLNGFFGGYWIWVAIFEVLVLIAESILWKWGVSSFAEEKVVPWRKCITVSVVSNVISFLVGLFIYYFPLG